ncbi:PhdYeFM domain-containing protein [Saccharothrix longispora]|uniref:type II toxin-antitoxin system Phd/YefM family antitoxin n=1 Tax=Saccharothrix longispora TaxID=33920 RepID=UPI0028FD48C1|nr:PhdYeFM domain-containing protein [Saccharothrix longispora]MBY8850967.1 PhdYeFM domain-containing protein [Saccharothrix sp. MB29]MDU0289010.1 PhdYeFM domain-containing protein [Saccharothrix longispora]
MKVIGQQEFHDDFAAVMDAVEAGETYRVTRDGVEIAEVRSLPRRTKFTTAELIERHRHLPHVDHAAMRAESDEFFGEDRVGDDDPWERRRG